MYVCTQSPIIQYDMGNKNVSCRTTSFRNSTFVLLVQKPKLGTLAHVLEDEAFAGQAVPELADPLKEPPAARV